MKGKSRCVLKGWKDPLIYQLERAAPTMVTLQWLASAKVSGHVSDLTNAFGQARKTSRKNKLATRLPPGVTTLFAGRRVVQHRNYRVTVSMDEYVKAKFRPIEVLS